MTDFQAFENNELMKLKARGESSEEAQAPVVDKVCVINQFDLNYRPEFK